MRRFCSLILVSMLFLSGCSLTLKGISGGPSCGNGICDNGENSTSCSRDCAAVFARGSVKTTFIKSEGSSGRIAVMVASPKVKRFSDGAGVVVVIPPLFSDPDGFIREPDFTSLGLVQVSYLWPGYKDKVSGMSSEGDFDAGGPNSIQVLRDVMRFAGGRLADVNGRYIFGLTTVPPLTDELGMYAFGDGGLAVVKALSLYGDQFQGLQYYIGRENPTIDSLASEEAGYYDPAGEPIYNPFYVYPAGYGFDSLGLNYTNLRWDPDYVGGTSALAGCPYLDLDSSGSISTGDYIFDGLTPLIGGKRYYSKALTQSLLDTGALALAEWPTDMATPQEATAYWSFLTSPDRYSALQNEPILKNLKVMLVFAREDHAQVAQDKPHIHQAYQGFRFQARLWVRLNPDRAYVEGILLKYAGASQGSPGAAATGGSILDFPDNPANTQPGDWAKIGDYAYPAGGAARRLVPLAAVAEMADRAHSGIWDENVGQMIFDYTGATPTP